MKASLVRLVGLALLMCATVSPEMALAWGSPMPKPQSRLLGTLSHGAYSFPGGKVRVKIPQLFEPGATIRDEKSTLSAQVILNDQFGKFYRVVVIDNSSGQLDGNLLLRVFNDIREKITITTARGEELRVIDVEKEGAELNVSTLQNDENGQLKVVPLKRPDLLTASAAFASGKMIIHVVAGLPMTPAYHGQIDELVPSVKELLEGFLSGIEIH